jgi:hypothetical protein
MISSNLVVICTTAFMAVFILLSILALVMRLILFLFPAKEAVSDAAVIAAVTSMYQTIYPGTKISKIEEAK